MKALIWLIVASVSSIVMAATQTGIAVKESSGESQGIMVDPSNFKEIFHQSVSNQSETLAKENGGFDVEVAGQYTSLSELTLANSYFDVDYSNSFRSLPGIFVGGVVEVFQVGDLTGAPAFSLAYGFKESKTAVRSKKGAQLNDVVAIHSVPLLAGFELKQRIPGARQFSVFLTPSVGLNWLNQTGSLDGISQSYWVPNLGVRTGLVLFELESPSIKSGRWFNGVTLSGSRRASLQSAQRFSVWSIELGLRILL